MIEIDALYKAFGPRYALRGIDLRIDDGQFVTLFGPNGAGKTTLLKILATLSRPTRGEVRVQGHRLSGDWTDVRRYIGLVSHQSFLYSDLTAEENLRFYASLFDVEDAETRIEMLLAAVGLQNRARDLVRTYSRGMLQRLAIARALIHDPLILLLDEPYTGLDQAAAERFTELLAESGRAERTVIMATHNLEQGLALCDRVLVMNQGEVVFAGPRAERSLDEWRAVYRQYVGGAAV